MQFDKTTLFFCFLNAIASSQQDGQTGHNQQFFDGDGYITNPEHQILYGLSEQNYENQNTEHTEYAQYQQPFNYHAQNATVLLQEQPQDNLYGQQHPSAYAYGQEQPFVPLYSNQSPYHPYKVCEDRQQREYFKTVLQPNEQYSTAYGQQQASIPQSISENLYEQLPDQSCIVCDPSLTNNYSTSIYQRPSFSCLVDQQNYERCCLEMSNQQTGNYYQFGQYRNGHNQYFSADAESSIQMQNLTVLENDSAYLSSFSSNSTIPDQNRSKTPTNILSQDLRSQQHTLMLGTGNVDLSAPTTSKLSDTEASTFLSKELPSKETFSTSISLHPSTPNNASNTRKEVELITIDKSMNDYSLNDTTHEISSNSTTELNGWELNEIDYTIHRENASLWSRLSLPGEFEKYFVTTPPTDDSIIKNNINEETRQIIYQKAEKTCKTIKNVVSRNPKYKNMHLFLKIANEMKDKIKKIKIITKTEDYTDNMIKELFTLIRITLGFLESKNGNHEIRNRPPSKLWLENLENLEILSNDIKNLLVNKAIHIYGISVFEEETFFRILDRNPCIKKSILSLR